MMNTPSFFGHRADFNNDAYDLLIAQKGRNIAIEKALICPCKSKDSDHLSTCQNCRGTGWIFINRKETRYVVQRQNISPEFKPWSEEVRGNISISYKHEENLAYMDRVTLLDSRSVFQEVLHFKSRTRTFCFTSYKILEVIYIGVFVSVSEPLQVLTSSDYEIEDDKIIITKTDLLEIEDLSATIRYKHYPTYHIIEVNREDTETQVPTAGIEQLEYLPNLATARKAHYIMDSKTVSGETVLNNSYSESC